MKKILSIAIDGPVASGKGTLAFGLARRLGALYVYTGAMYRALALACLEKGVDVNSEDKVLKFLDSIVIELREPKPEDKRTFTVFLNGVDVSLKIYDKRVDQITPIIAAMPSIRARMVKLQKKIAKGKSVVMEGRDITTDVLPNADIKIYLTASFEERTKRRHMQLKKRGDSRSLEEIINEIKERDMQDFGREASPLKIQKDVEVIDTTNLTIKETVELVMQELRKKNLI